MAVDARRDIRILIGDMAIEEMLDLAQHFFTA